jgi:arginine decarboxylase
VLNNETRVSAKGLLRDAISRHNSLERASFHTPGHKGLARLPRLTRISQIDPGKNDPRKIVPAQIDRGQNLDLMTDVTELPGLDDLSHPTGVLANLNHKASRLWNTRGSLVSVNGASAGMVAAILSISTRGKKIVVPRNAHKSVITGLVMSGLEPIWYTPEWNSTWGVYDHVASSTLASILEQHAATNGTRAQNSKAQNSNDAENLAGIAAVVVVSPTYAGAFSDVNAIGSICKRAGIALIVDEAHGAHVFHGSDSPRSITSHSAESSERRSLSAVEAGADIVIHSLHKTLGAMTQTGLVHLPHYSKITEATLSHHLNMLHSTSPSYTLMLSIEDALGELCGSGIGISDTTVAASEQAGNTLKQVGSALEQGEDTGLERINRLARNLKLHLTGSKFQIYDTACGTDNWHVLLRHETKNSTELFDYLLSQGIYPECELGAGVLLLLGVGTSEADIALLIEALNDFSSLNLLDMRISDATISAIATSAEIDLAQPPSIDQVMDPRTASMALSEQVAIADAENFIAAECIAPCPPGIPTCVPGQRLTKEVLNQIAKDHVRVVQSPQPNT